MFLLCPKVILGSHLGYHQVLDLPKFHGKEGLGFILGATLTSALSRGDLLGVHGLTLEIFGVSLCGVLCEFLGQSCPRTVLFMGPNGVQILGVSGHTGAVSTHTEGAGTDLGGVS